MSIRKRWQQFRQHILARRLPHGLMGWRYLWPLSNLQVRQHRAFWWRSGDTWPRPIWLTTEILIWVRWLLWFAWVASWRIVRTHGKTYADRTQLPLHRQYLTVLSLSLRWCIHPRDAYRFNLILQPYTALDYIYDQETNAFHRSRNPNPTRIPESYACIQDKIALADRLQQLGVTVVTTIQIVSRGDHKGLPEILKRHGSRGLFLKTRSGNQGRGAFAIWPTATGHQGQTFEGAQLLTQTAIEIAWRTLVEMDDILIQPGLTNHPELAPMSLTGEAITVRYITQLSSNNIASCLSATLEVPAGQTRNRKTFYSIFPIEAASGQLKRFPRQILASQESLTASEQIWALAPAEKNLPNWTALVQDSHRAHEAFQDTRAIAWDWVITPDGPILLEGNVGWGTATPQILAGGFLRCP